MRGRIWLGGPRSLFPVPVNPAAEMLLPAGLGSYTGLYVAVRRIGATDGLAYVHIADSVVATNITWRYLCRSGGI